MGKEDTAYKSYLEDIAKELNSLKSMWDAGYFSHNSFEDWQKRFKPKQDEFMQKYSDAKKVSYSFMKVVFEQLNDFLTTLEDIERTNGRYKESLKVQSSGDIKTKLETLLEEHKEFAEKALLRAIKYNSLAIEKATLSVSE